MTDACELGAITAGEVRSIPRVDETLSPLSDVGRPSWQAKVRRRIEQLEPLKENWDARGSEAVNPDALIFAFAVLHRVMPPRGPAPEIHALGHGGVQLSWASPDAEIDLEVIAPNKLLVTYWDRAGGGEQEWSATNDVERLQSALWRHFKN